MNSRGDLQKYADDGDEKGKNSSEKQDQNLKLSWETGREIQNSDQTSQERLLRVEFRQNFQCSGASTAPARGTWGVHKSLPSEQI